MADGQGWWRKGWPKATSDAVVLEEDGADRPCGKGSARRDDTARHGSHQPTFSERPARNFQEALGKRALKGAGGICGCSHRAHCVQRGERHTVCGTIVGGENFKPVEERVETSQNHSERASRSGMVVETESQNSTSWPTKGRTGRRRHTSTCLQSTACWWPSPSSPLQLKP